MGKFGTKAVSVLLVVVVVATALVWWLAPAHAPWFLFGLFLGLLLLYLICRFLLEPPPPGRRLRLINCDADKHLRKLRVWAKRNPEDTDWRTRQPLALDLDLKRDEWIEFSGFETVEVYALRAEVDASNEHPREPMVTYEAEAPEQQFTMEGATIHFRLQADPKLVIEPNHIREQCP
jgi:uncharacterized protein YqcC (DUF446 family)